MPDRISSDPISPYYREDFDSFTVQYRPNEAHDWTILTDHVEACVSMGFVIIKERDQITGEYIMQPSDETQHVLRQAEGEVTIA